MTIKKGDTLYRIENGEPIRVHSVRSMPNTDGRQVRLYLNRGAGTYRHHADLFDGKLGESSNYSLTQTAELARKWADTLNDRAEAMAAEERERNRERLTRLANRDRLNAPPRITVPMYAGDESRITLTCSEQDRTGAIVTQTRHYGASVFRDMDRIVGENGEYVRVESWGVNWSALGTQSPAVARAYAQAILAAADLADERNASPTTEEN